jgi:hypothetical protein
MPEEEQDVDKIGIRITYDCASLIFLVVIILITLLLIKILFF